MRRLLLVCMLMLLPLQWSWAAAAWYGMHADHDAQAAAAWGHTSLATPADATPPSGDDTASSDTGAAGDGPCCHLDDAQWVSALPAVMAPLQAAPPRFEYFAPTSSHIPAGPERPDRSLAA